MMKINIDKNTLIGIICVTIAIILIAIMIFIGFIYYTKKKFYSIDEYNKRISNKLNTYYENKKQYEKNLKELGVKQNTIKKFCKTIKNHLKK